jgi:hypothetical protein
MPLIELNNSNTHTSSNGSPNGHRNGFGSQNHKRQGSNGYNKHDQSPMDTSFASLDNFMTITKHMEDEIMVPSKLKDKRFVSSENRMLTSGLHTTEQHTSGNSNSDALDHYRFLCLLRDQFLESQPFSELDESKGKILNNNESFQKTFDQVKYHYSELMTLMDGLCHEAKGLTNVYKVDV